MTPQCCDIVAVILLLNWLNLVGFYLLKPPTSIWTRSHCTFNTHTIVQRWKSPLWPWFCENGVNTLMLGCNCGPVLCQSHYSACIQEPITVRVTHCGGARWKDKPSGWLVGGVGVITWHKRNQLNVIQPSRVIPRCNIYYANLSVTTNPFKSIFFVRLQIPNILSVFLKKKLNIYNVSLIDSSRQIKMSASGGKRQPLTVPQQYAGEFKCCFGRAAAKWRISQLAWKITLVAHCFQLNAGRGLDVRSC